MILYDINICVVKDIPLSGLRSVLLDCSNSTSSLHLAILFSLIDPNNKDANSYLISLKRFGFRTQTLNSIDNSRNVATLVLNRINNKYELSNIRLNKTLYFKFISYLYFVNRKRYLPSNIIMLNKSIAINVIDCIETPIFCNLFKSS